MSAPSNGFDTIICNRLIGKHDSVDLDDDCNTYYEFVPNADAQSAGIPSAEILNIDFTTGRIESLDDDGNVLVSLDLIETLTKIGKNL